MLYNSGDMDASRQRFMEFRKLLSDISEEARAADAEMMDQQHALAQLLGLSTSLDS